MATKCLPLLVVHVRESNAVLTVQKLLEYVLTVPPAHARSTAPEVVGQKAVRDVASLALKSTVQQLAVDSKKAASIAQIVVPDLLTTISSSSPDVNPDDALIDALELLYEVVSRFGSLLETHQRKICEALFVHFICKSALVRKRTISCLAALGGVCGNEIFLAIVERALLSLQEQDVPNSIRTGVQTISALSKTSGHRLAPHLQSLVPILLDLINDNGHVQDDDLREHCLQALESFCLRCAPEMLPFAPRLTSTLLALSKYDPNYIVDEDGDEDEDEERTGDDMGDDGDYDEEFDDADYSDDDDTSWKVRRASVRCIHAIISAQLIPPKELSSVFGPFLVSRFKEREETVKLDVFAAFGDLLRLCGRRSKPAPYSGSSTLQTLPNTDAFPVHCENDAGPLVESLASRGTQIVRNLNIELSSRSSKTKVKAMALARIIATHLPSLVTPLVEKVMTAVKQGLTDSATGMRSETLLFLRMVVKIGGAEPLAMHIQGLMYPVFAATNDRYYKVTAECLRFCGATVSAFGKSSPQIRSKLSPLISGIYSAARGKATAQDQDAEVKEAALICLGATVSHFSSDLTSDQLSEVAYLLRDRLNFDVTRICTVRVIYMIATSESAHILTPVIEDVVSAVSSFLRKSNSALRIAAVELLTVIPVLPSSIDSLLITNISELISDGDLRMASMALQLATKIVKDRGSSVIERVSQPGSVYSKALELSSSTVLQGRAVVSLLELFSSLANVNSSPLTIQDMLQALEKQADSLSFTLTTSSARGSPLFCIAKCIMYVCRAAEANLRIQTTSQIITNINSSDFKTRIFALACLAEFGRGSLLPKEGNEKEVVRKAVLDALQAPVEEVKAAAAVAFGGLASADGASDVPALVELIKMRSEQRYLLLLSLKESIVSVNAADLRPLVPSILPLLLEPTTSLTGENPNTSGSHSVGVQGRSSEEESIRTATAECLGYLADSCPESVIDTLVDAAASENRDVRGEVASAVKFAMSSSMASGSSPSPQLRSSILTFLKMVSDSDVMVAKNAVQATNTIAKSYPALLVPHLRQLLPMIYARTRKDTNLVRVVDLGPFKHEEDFGLDLRKSAFDCLRTLISGPLSSSIQMVGMLEYVVAGLHDQTDVRSIAQLILVAAAGTGNASQMITVMDSIVGALENTLNERLKDNAVRQEVERYEDSIRGALRAVRAMESVSVIANNRAFQGLLNGVVMSPRLMERYQAIAKSEVNILTTGNRDFSIDSDDSDDTMQD